MTDPRQRRIDSPADLRRVTGADFTVSEQQWKAISAPLEPAVVIAGAGSGKTELMSARVIYLVANEFITPDQVLGLTFTTKATAELGERIRTALDRAGLTRSRVSEDGAADEILEPTVLTYNSYGAGLLADHGLRIGHEADLRVMADASRFQLAQRVINAHRGEVNRLSDHPATVVQYLLALDGEMSEHLVSVEQVRAFHVRERPRFVASLQQLIDEGGKTKGKQGVLAKVIGAMDQREELLGLVEEYRALKADLGLIDFSDQIAGAHRLATEHPEVGAAERDRFKIVLLDEYQDTSVAQARLLASLFSGPGVASGRGHAVMAVGDPNQAIYGWRGASVANITQFPDHFPTTEGGRAEVLPLTVNRRSDASILGVANRLAQPLYDDPSTPVVPLEAKPDASAGLVRGVRHRTHSDELDWIAGRIKATHEAGTPWGEIGVLVRTNKHGAEAYDVLSEAGIPVEIVGLGGLIRLPEVAQLVATLSLLEDLTDNAALLTLLTGPRWEIGVRDLALLGRRSAELAGHEGRQHDDVALAEQIRESVAGADPTEIASLCEALDNPGDLPYSAQARSRFEMLAGELRHLRNFTGEPLLDLLRRIMDVCGLDVELASSMSPAAAARRENLDLFIKAVADFQAVDGSVTLGALNAWLDTEDDYGGGLDLAAPSESDAVKLLTVHRAKGLEYDVVHLIGVGKKKFPNETLRPQWTTSCKVLPAPLRGDREHVPQAPGYSADDIAGDADGSLEHQARRHQRDEELRLGYVAYTRARHEFTVSSHAWAPSPKTEILPSPYQDVVVDFVREQGREPDPWWISQPEDTNPYLEVPTAMPWPAEPGGEARRSREQAAAMVRAAADVPGPDPAGLSPEEQALVDVWDDELDRLVTEAREQSATDVVEVPLPPSLSATALQRLAADPSAFARAVARPMPRKPVPQARFGTRFHAWVETRWGQQQLLDPDELPGRSEDEVVDDSDLKALQAQFEAGQFAQRTPVAVEPAFSLVLAGQLIRGRIDAVFETEPGHFLVVDWKTNKAQTADPLQLAIYRQAWAELAVVSVEQVRAAFYYVRTDDLVEPEQLADRDELETLVGRAVSGDTGA